jgi:hypothetical protein
MRFNPLKRPEMIPHEFYDRADIAWETAKMLYAKLRPDVPDHA